MIVSCDYAKQQKELTQLKSYNMELKSKIKKMEIESIIKKEKVTKDPHKIRAIIIIDSLKFNDHKTFQEIEKEIETNIIK